MGKQINFYVDKELEKKFNQYFLSQGFVILAEDLKNKKLAFFYELSEVDPQIYIMYLYKKDYGQILLDKECDYRLDYLRSPVIEFTRTLIKHEKKIITRGRIWMESKYYDDNGKIVCKDPKLNKEYNLLVKWIKKYVPFQEVKNGDYIVKEYVTDSIKDITSFGYRLI